MISVFMATLCFAVVCLLSPQSRLIVSVIVLPLVVSIPILLYRSFGQMIDQNPDITERKTLEFGPSKLVSVGRTWKKEFAWTYFRDISEDVRYFYLHLNDSGLVSIVPKSAFLPEQDELFRQYGHASFPGSVQLSPLQSR